VKGTENVLRSVQNSGTVRRVIYSSSIAAIIHAGRPMQYVWTEADWASDGDPAGFSVESNAYAKSKVGIRRGARGFRGGQIASA
jgi:nucleoside-diphosphate-sugar epimerase